MIDQISLPGLAVAILLPWLGGVILLRCLLRKTTHWNWFIIVGQGYFIGIFFLTLIIRALSAAGFTIDYWLIAGALTLCCVVGCVYILTESSKDYQTQKHSIPIPLWQWACITILISLVTIRYSVLLQELLLKPLYSWDSWMNWVPKAVVWFHHETLVNYIHPQDWLKAGQQYSQYTLGNYHAWSYPPTIPIILVWNMIGAGVSDHTALFIPWMLASINLSISLYGYLRLCGSSAVAATLAVYCLLNLPYLNVHIALPGYADLWLAAAFGCALLALCEWERCRRPEYALFCAILAGFCTQLKLPGIVLGAIVYLALFRSLLDWSLKRELGIYSILLLLLTSTLIIGMDTTLPIIGQVSLSLSKITLPIFGEFDLAYHPIEKPIVETLLTMNNWYLLWYIAIILLPIGFLRARFLRELSSFLFALFLAILFMVIYFFFTHHYWTAESFTTVNRWLIYLIAPTIYVSARIIRVVLAAQPK